MRLGAAVTGASVEADVAGTRYVYVDGAANVLAAAPWVLRLGVGGVDDAVW